MLTALLTPLPVLSLSMAGLIRFTVAQFSTCGAAFQIQQHCRSHLLTQCDTVLDLWSARWNTVCNRYLLSPQHWHSLDHVFQTGTCKHYLINPPVHTPQSSLGLHSAHIHCFTSHFHAQFFVHLQHFSLLQWVAAWQGPYVQLQCRFCC